MDAKARLEEVVRLAYRDFAAGSNPRRGLAETVADALLAAGVSLPEPPGPVTSEEAHRTFRDALSTGSNSFSDYGHLDDEDMVVERHALDAAMPLLARDHGLLTPAEVERRAREWWRRGGGGFSGLVTALTAPAATSAASTRTDGGGR